MNAGARVYYVNLAVKLTVILGGLLLATHFNEDWKIDQSIVVGGYDLFQNINTESGIFAIFFGIFAVVGWIEGKYAWDSSGKIAVGEKQVTLGNLGAFVAFALMLFGIVYAVEELFVGDDNNDWLNDMKSYYFLAGVIVFFWLGKEEFIFSRRALNQIYGKVESAY